MGNEGQWVIGAEVGVEDLVITVELYLRSQLKAVTPSAVLIHNLRLLPLRSFLAVKR